MLYMYEYTNHENTNHSSDTKCNDHSEHIIKQFNNTHFEIHLDLDSVISFRTTMIAKLDLKHSRSV